MDWTDLQVFVEVARTGSMAEAGRVLDMSAPTVRRRLDALEVACGFTLFVKSALGLKATAVARRLMVHATEASRAAEAAARDLSATANRVTVAAIELVTDRILAPAAVEIMTACPGLAVTLESHLTRESLASSAADIVILASPLPPKGTAVRLGDMEIGLYAHRDYLRDAPALNVASDLAGHRIIGARSRAATPFILGRLGLTGQPLSFSFLSDSTLAQSRALIGAGGVTAYYSDLADRDPDLIRVLPDTIAVFDLWLWQPGGAERPAVRNLSAAVIESMRPYVTGGSSPERFAPSVADA